MSVDLLWQRQVEYWLRLMGVQSVVNVCENISFKLGPYGFNLDYLASNTQISVSYEVPERDQVTLLIKTLSKLKPESIKGAPIRAWVAQRRLWLSAVFPQEFGAEYWYASTLIQLKILTTVEEEGC